MQCFNCRFVVFHSVYCYFFTKFCEKSWLLVAPIILLFDYFSVVSLFFSEQKPLQMYPVDAKKVILVKVVYASPLYLILSFPVYFHFLVFHFEYILLFSLLLLLIDFTKFVKKKNQTYNL